MKTTAQIQFNARQLFETHALTVEQTMHLVLKLWEVESRVRELGSAHKEIKQLRKAGHRLPKGHKFPRNTLR